MHGFDTQAARLYKADQLTTAIKKIVVRGGRYDYGGSIKSKKLFTKKIFKILSLHLNFFEMNNNAISLETYVSNYNNTEKENNDFIC